MNTVASARGDDRADALPRGVGLLNNCQESTDSPMNNPFSQLIISQAYDIKHGSCVDPVMTTQSTVDVKNSSSGSPANLTKSQVNLKEFIKTNNMFQKIEDDCDTRAIRSAKAQFFNKMKKQEEGGKPSRPSSRKGIHEEFLKYGKGIDKNAINSGEYPSEGVCPEVTVDFIRCYGTPV